MLKQLFIFVLFALWLPLASYAAQEMPTYNPQTGELVIPKIYMGDDEFHVVLKLEMNADDTFSFTTTTEQIKHLSVLTFKKAGESVGKFSLTDLKEKFSAINVSIVEPHYNRKIDYRGFPVRELFDLIYGKEWRSIEEVLFTTLDDYKSSIRVKKFLDHTAYLVFKAQDYADFQVVKVFTSNTGPGTFEVADLGPFYIVWENIKDQNAPSGEDFPYQIVSIDLINFTERFPKMTVPSALNNNMVQQGFLQYRQHCMACHKVNNEGGTRGPELTHVTQKHEFVNNVEALRQKIINPKSRVMPPLAPELELGENVETVTDEIVAYLQVMAQSKYGAVAYFCESENLNDCYIGYSNSHSSQEEANQRAIEKCGAADCEVVEKLINVCGVVVEVADNWEHNGEKYSYRYQKWSTQLDAVKVTSHETNVQRLLDSCNRYAREKASNLPGYSFKPCTVIENSCPTY